MDLKLNLRYDLLLAALAATWYYMYQCSKEALVHSKKIPSLAIIAIGNVVMYFYILLYLESAGTKPFPKITKLVSISSS